MSELKIYSVSNRYINFLRKDKKLRNVFDNKEETATFTRKYLGVVFVHGDFNYYIPFSSPKESDYMINTKGEKEIRKSLIPIIRMVTSDTATGKFELKGTLKLSNMIPVPKEELTPYIISDEKDLNYKQVVTKEYSFITANVETILKNAKVIYNQKTKADELYAGKTEPGYLKSTVDFIYAENKCLEFIKTYLKTDNGCKLV